MSPLTVIGGRLRVASCGGPLVVSDAGASPCCCNCPTECTLSESGVQNTDNYGWSVEKGQGNNAAKDPNNLPKTLPISISFKFETAANCGGTNDNTQSGSLSCCFFLSEETEIEVEVSGNVELQNFGFDTSTATVGGVTATIGSIGAGQGCAMRDVSDKKSVTLPAGAHTYTFNTSTNDPLYHSGMTHTFKISKK